jgi:hypothetical protein
MICSNRLRWLPALLLLCCLPGIAATVFKTVDADGLVIFSDTRPAGDSFVETIVIDVQAPASDSLAQQRLREMRETTDRMVADRMAREKHRAEMAQLHSQTNARQSPLVTPEYYGGSPVYAGYYGYPLRRPWRHHYKSGPEHPIARPPVHPPAQNRPTVRRLPGNSYPASLIRRSYDPKVSAALR